MEGALFAIGGFVVGFFARQAMRSPGDRPRTAKAVPSKRKAAQAGKTAAAPAPREELKMVLCVNMSLKMGTGKIGAQCAHAAVGVLQAHASSHGTAFRHWERYGQPKIALKVQDEEEMSALEAKAQSLGFPTYLVHDAGAARMHAAAQTGPRMHAGADACAPSSGTPPCSHCTLRLHRAHSRSPAAPCQVADSDSSAQFMALVWKCVSAGPNAL